MDLFTKPADRAKAMGVYGFVCSGGSSVGAVLGAALIRSPVTMATPQVS
jgi:hypothetical protein